MENILSQIAIGPGTIYLALILNSLGIILKKIPQIKNHSIIGLLFIIGILYSINKDGVTTKAIGEAIIATSIATTTYQSYKQTKEAFLIKAKKD